MGWDLTRTGGWRAYCGLLVALFLARGIWLLCVIPPLEPWDEYQHIAYFQHLVEHGERPVLFARDAMVSEALMREAAQLPQPEGMLEQTRGSGARSYAAHWEEPEKLAPAAPQPRVFLYQAQHGPFYYRLAGPVFRAFGGVAELRTSIAALRVCNLLLGAAALGIAVSIFALLFEDRRYAALAGLLIATQPLFLLNTLRVSNDAIAILFATVVVAWAIQPRYHDSIAWAIAAGLAAGAALLAKGFGLLAPPLMVLAVGVSIALGQVRRPRAAVALGVALAVAGLVSAPQLLFNWEHYGSLSGMIEAVSNRNAGLGFGDYLASAAEIRWPSSIAFFWLRGSSWIGGWSFLQVGSTLRTVVTAVLVLMACGWAGWLWPRRRAAGGPFRIEGTLLRLSALMVLMTLGLAYHMLQSHLAQGQIMTNSWYATLAYPWALALVCAGSGGWPLGAVRFSLPWTLVGLYVSIEISGALLKMVPFYSGGASGLLALERLASLQPPALGTFTLLTSATLGIGLLLLAIFLCATASSTNTTPAR